jgi:hypothetical protein
LPVQSSGRVLSSRSNGAAGGGSAAPHARIRPHAPHHRSICAELAGGLGRSTASTPKEDSMLRLFRNLFILRQAWRMLRRR